MTTRPHDTVRLAIVGDVATQLWTKAIRRTLTQQGFQVALFEAPYNQVARQLLAEDSDLHAFRPSVVVVWESVERWWATGESVAARLARVRAYAQATAGQLLYLNCAPYTDGVFGSYATHASFATQVRAFNAGLDALAEELPNLFVVDLNSLVATVGRTHAVDPLLTATAAMPLTLEVQETLAARVCAIVAAQQGAVRKCVVVDLDNTLWAGVLGEDGIDGVVCGEQGLGWAHLQLQRWLLRLRQRGILLAVCSKNDEALVRDAFAAHARDWALQLEDFVCLMANWRSKAENLAQIRRTLNLGFESLVFLDDNPAERALIRQAYPCVCVPELPTDPAQWLPYLIELNLFETVSHSDADAARTDYYRASAARAAEHAAFTDEAGYLKSLEMSATVTPLTPQNIPRVAQLTQRTNQFNVRTVRYTEAELSALLNRPAYLTLCFSLSDRFGAQGLVSVLLVRLDGTRAFIEMWLMSCRVVQRGLELFALNTLVARLKAAGVTHLVGTYIPTAKNGLVASLYTDLGFEPCADGSFVLPLDTYRPKETFIREEDA